MNWGEELAVVTGASTGIGRALAETLVERGASVALCARNGPRIERLAQELRVRGATAFAVACDVRDERQVGDFASGLRTALGTPTILINNAGVGRFATVAQMSVEQWDETLETNLRGMFLMTRAVLPDMLAAGRGAVVNMASLAGRNGFAAGAAYCASKHGVLGFSKSLMMEVRQRGIRVIAVCPGSVDTPFFDNPETPFDPNRDRILTPEDVAGAIVAALELDERATVSELDIRPTNP